MTRVVLASLHLGDVEDLTVSVKGPLLYLEASMDGCGSTSVLDRDEAQQLREALDRFLVRFGDDRCSICRGSGQVGQQFDGLIIECPRGCMTGADQ